MVVEGPVELRIGQRRVRLLGDSLELDGAAVTARSLQGFRLSRRPLLGAIALGFLFAGLAALVQSRDVRLLLLLLDGVMLLGAFLYARYRFAALTEAGEVIAASMVVRRGSREERELREAFARLRAFLSVRGVREGR